MSNRSEYFANEKLANFPAIRPAIRPAYVKKATSAQTAAIPRWITITVGSLAGLILAVKVLSQFA